MEFLVEWKHLDALLFDRALLLWVPAASLAAVLAVALSYTNRHVEVGDLVGVLARRWHLDWTGPVVVEVAQSVGQLLELNA